MLILASGSPRRRELIEKLHIPYMVEVSGNEELIPEGMSPEKLPEYLSGEKAKAVFEKHRGDTVIGADTIVLYAGKILGKPSDKEEAKSMLRLLSGRKHEVITGVSIISEKKSLSFSESCEVEFYELSDEEIDAYIATGEPMDKAGAYGIQGDGALLVKAIHGDYYTVMGLPIAELSRKLKGFVIL
ncbi:MAG: Maf family protein [Candidatus Avilachnospira sp.]|jgi:septum formation protein